MIFSQIINRHVLRGGKRIKKSDINNRIVRRASGRVTCIIDVFIIFYFVCYNIDVRAGQKIVKKKK